VRKGDKVTICVPAYNAADFIGETLDSLSAQTYTNIEILVQDNASTDRTADVIAKAAMRDPRIRLFRNPSNIGYVRNIWTVVERAEAEVVCIYHADDLYEPFVVELELEALLDSGADGAFGRYREFRKPGGRLYPYPVVPPFREGNRYFCGGLDDYLPTILERGNPFCCPSFMTRKAAFVESGGFTDEFPSNEDMDLWLKYLIAGRRLAISSDFLVRYRRSDSQGSSSWDARDELPVFYSVIEARISGIKGLPVALAESYRRNKARGYLLAYRNAMRKGRRDKAEGFLAMSREAYPMGPDDGLWFAFQRWPWLFRLAKRLSARIKRSL
jgi:glycosyltransferase involved in cell wall biosynthesis